MTYVIGFEKLLHRQQVKRYKIDKNAAYAPPTTIMLYSMLFIFHFIF